MKNTMDDVVERLEELTEKLVEQQQETSEAIDRLANGLEGVINAIYSINNPPKPAKPEVKHKYEYVHTTDYARKPWKLCAKVGTIGAIYRPYIEEKRFEYEISENNEQPDGEGWEECTDIARNGLKTEHLTLWRRKTMYRNYI